jgi:hypothetical protein
VVCRELANSLDASPQLLWSDCDARRLAARCCLHADRCELGELKDRFCILEYKWISFLLFCSHYVADCWYAPCCLLMQRGLWFTGGKLHHHVKLTAYASTWCAACIVLPMEFCCFFHP